ncbi:MAG TPA: cell division protein ZapA [Thermoanaerobaculia bacterium]|nr:cell division protein ZapA [Thermoanaerobaculia bacterium]HUM29414.1 cell division protein ZapA [Thermoanaerobaculia bacterium]HXK67660.1 cell division protein ZapA [Thermoanaerobaculia bacterium]
MDANLNILEVEIFDRIYRLKSDKDPEYLDKLASYLDEKMKEVAEVAPTVDGQKIAVLAALNIADEYFQLKNFKEGDSRNIEDRAKEMLKKLKRTLEEGA